MSKCRINKYKASSGGFGPDRCSNQQNDLQAPFSQLMAARDAQDRRMTETSPKVEAQAIVSTKPPIQDKKTCIDIILGGDF
jgi:hypothetical protein